MAPVENVLVGQREVETPLMASFFTTLVPAVLVEQKADPAAEYSPLPLQGAQPAKFNAPLSAKVPAGQGRSNSPLQ